MGATAEAREARARGLKWCSTCRRARRRESFHRNRSTHDGLQAVCKTCHKQNAARQRERRVA